MRLILLSIIVSFAFVSQFANATDRRLGSTFKQYKNVKIRALSPKYNRYLGAMVRDYTSKTKVRFSRGPNHLRGPYKGHVAFMDVNYGPSRYAAKAFLFNEQGQQCYTRTGYWNYTNCNKNKKISFALIELNTGVISHRNAPSGFPQYVVAHEIGHVFGMDHDTTCPGKHGHGDTDSIMMSNTACGTLRTKLMASDINFFNRTYN